MNLFYFLISFFISFSVLGHDYFSSFTEDANQVCSQLTDVCVSYQSKETFTSKKEATFKLIIKHPSLMDTPFKLNKVDLWMQMGGHGHGSSPLNIKNSSDGTYDITKAYFVMAGEWQIRVNYQYGNVNETLIIPVLVE
jgi:hypothetical protein